jgi:hypothetical protein
VRQPGSDDRLGLFLMQAHAVSEARGRLAMAERPSEVVIEVDSGTYDVDSNFGVAGYRI